MKQAEYILETHVHHQPVKRQRTFTGTRIEAKQECIRLDRDVIGQTTTIAFVRYQPEVKDESV